MSDFWVFGYGSLIWNPGFPFAASRTARIFGLHRALCIYSWVHRGTKNSPGLVLGLDKGGSCRGTAFRVEGKNKTRVLDYLRKRELVTDVYRESWRRVHFQNGTSQPALTYVADRSNPQYCGPLPVEKQIKIVTSASGKSGANSDYVLKTVEHMRKLSIRDARLEIIAGNLNPAIASV